MQLVSDQVVLYQSPLPAEKSIFEQWFSLSPFLDNLAEFVQTKEPLKKTHIMHTIEGRIRIKVPLLNLNKEYAQVIKSSIESIQGVKSIEVNPEAASLTVYYDKQIPRVTFERILLDKTAI